MVKTQTFPSSDSESASEHEEVESTSNQDRDKIIVNTRPIPDYISEDLQKALKAMKINSLFEVQYMTIDDSISGNDMIVQAATGSGKTLSFALPTIERLVSSGLKFRKNQPRVLVLAPTRELAVQIDKVFNELTKFSTLRCIPIYGGVSYNLQKEQLSKPNLGVVTGTPGRVKDMINNGYIDISKVKVVILDEVDRMLDMGFSDDVEEILSYAPYKTEKASSKPQTLFYSATCPDWVLDKAAEVMSEDYKHTTLVDDRVKIGGTSETVEHLSIQIDRFEAVSACVRDLVRLYSAGRSNGRAIVFTQTKRDANDLALGDISIGDAQVMHGDIEQKQREVTLKGFREGKFRCLVATDVAARGLDIPQIDLVIQTSPPMGGDIESYVHRSGRTGRAGKKGVCVCIYNFKNKFALKAIQKQTGIEFRDVPIPQPIDVAKSVMAEKLDEGIKKVINDKKETFENFTEMSKDVVKACKGDKDKAIACLLTFIAQGGEDIKSRSMISAVEGYQTWILETDLPRIGSPVGMIKSVLSRQGVDATLIQDLKTWRLLAEETSVGGAGVVFDLKSSDTNAILKAWPENETKLCGREHCMLKKCGKSIPKMQEFKSSYSGGDRGNSGGFRRGQRGGGFRNGSKRSFGGERRNGFNKKFKAY